MALQKILSTPPGGEVGKTDFLFILEITQPPPPSTLYFH